MAEEHRFQSPEGHRLCANNCGFFGSPTTMNFCSKCYRDLCLNEQQQASIKSSVETSLMPSSSSSSPLVAPVPKPEVGSIDAISPAPKAPAVEIREVPAPAPAVASNGAFSGLNRCLVCRKRVGLTGFKCRCGTTFCGTHRYPEKHECSFDFKRVGKEEIARANPLVKAEKLDKI